MEARIFHAALSAAALLSLGAGYRTTNFIVSAPTPQLSREIADSAECYRRELAIEWLGHELPRWSQPCPITAHVSPRLNAGGATSFMFQHGRPFGWRMTIQGSQSRVLDSVLPHEVTHTIFATHFGRPLPRWADEGACTTVEHESEKMKQHNLLIHFLTHHRGIAFNRMFAMKEYPQDILPLYSQGYSLARYLIMQGGKKQFVKYVGDGMRMNNWTAATKKHYGMTSLSELQITWLDWVRHGSPRIGPLIESAGGDVQVASATNPTDVQSDNIRRTMNGMNDDGGSAASSPRSFDSGRGVQLAQNSRGPRNNGISWYVRQGKLARRTGGHDRATKSQPSGNPHSTAPNQGPSAAVTGKAIERAVTRPQPPQRTQQIILDGPPSFRPVGQLSPVIPAPPVAGPIYVMPLNQGGTVLR